MIYVYHPFNSSIFLYSRYFCISFREKKFLHFGEYMKIDFTSVGFFPSTSMSSFVQCILCATRGSRCCAPSDAIMRLAQECFPFLSKFLNPSLLQGLTQDPLLKEYLLSHMAWHGLPLSIISTVVVTTLLPWLDCFLSADDIQAV